MMRLMGYCTGCHRFRYVDVKPQDLAFYAAGVKRVPTGVCHECEAADRKRRE